MVTSAEGWEYASYTEANFPAQAIERAKEQFPPGKGWHTFGCRHLDSRVETWEKDKPAQPLVERTALILDFEEPMIDQEHINAYTPPIVVLDKLAEIVVILCNLPERSVAPRISELITDSGVQSWIARMRHLERLPAEKSATPFTDHIRSALSLEDD